MKLLPGLTGDPSLLLSNSDIASICADDFFGTAAMAMPSVLVSGVWHTCTELHVLVSGTWHPVTELYVLQGGAWHPVV